MRWAGLGWAESYEKPEQTNERMNKYIGCAFRSCCSQSLASCSDGYSFSFLFFFLVGFNVIFYIYKNNTNSNILLYLSANSRVREHWARSDCQINWVRFFFLYLRHALAVRLKPIASQRSCSNRGWPEQQSTERNPLPVCGSADVATKWSVHSIEFEKRTFIHIYMNINIYM